MKKVFLMFAAAMLTASVSAQNTTITANKAGDNLYVGVNAGVATPMTKLPYGAEAEGAGFLKGIAPSFGVRVGKNLTTVFGLAVDANMYFKSSDKSYMHTKTFVNATDVDLLGTFNLSNLFCGYKGEPRSFEVIALGGFGWFHNFGTVNRENALTSKAAIDLALNLGKNKAWQVYLEPAVVFGLWNNSITSTVGANALSTAGAPFKFDSRNGIFQVNLGVNYKFGTSNGTHNYAKAQLRDQAEIDGLNAQINQLRADNDAKANTIANDNKTINDLKSQLEACKARPTQTVVQKKIENTSLQPIVIFGQGKTTVDAAGMASIDMIAKYMKNHKDSKVLVEGYASPEGSKEVNDRIAQARADAVKNVLVKKYKIAADRIEAKGKGVSKEENTENDFLRVAKFEDITKK